MNGEETAARYAFPPNSRGYCGAPSFRKALLANIAGADNAADLRHELSKFHVHYSFLGLIAKENGLSRFDPKVVEAFWIGNRLLENVSAEALKKFIANDLFQGKLPDRAKSLADNLPEGVVPHHSFNPLYINFVTDSVARSVKNYDSCCVTFGSVLKLSDSNATVRRQSIAWDDGFLLAEKDGRFTLEKNGARLAGPLNVGDLVSIHWGVVVQKIRKKDLNSLLKYTRINMEAVNAKKRSV